MPAAAELLGSLFWPIADDGARGGVAARRRRIGAGGALGDARHKRAWAHDAAACRPLPPPSRSMALLITRHDMMSPGTRPHRQRPMPRRPAGKATERGFSAVRARRGRM